MSRMTQRETIKVDPALIERSLAELWKVESSAEEGVTRAALWNVIAHTKTDELHAKASETLGRVSVPVPHRAIVIRIDRQGQPDLTSWISGHCHVLGDGKQVCSEEIAIVAKGGHIDRVPPLVNALLIPDMPVALWWIGDLPTEHKDYVASMLRPADRMIFDSIFFDEPSDLALVQRLCTESTTQPADLNWARLEEWRLATATIFDPPHMRARLTSIRAVRVMSSVDDPNFFGQLIEPLFYTSWLTTQAGQVVAEDGKVSGATGSIEYTFKYDRVEKIRGVLQVEIEFGDGSVARISRDPQRCVLLTNVDGVTRTPESVTRTTARGSDALIVRQLEQVEPDRVFLRVLPVSTRLARRIGA